MCVANSTSTSTTAASTSTTAGGSRTTAGGSRTAGIASLAAQSAGAAMQAVGAVYAAGAQKRALRTQAFMDELNARQAQRDANTAIIQGERAEQIKRLETAGVKSRAKASYGANGIALDSRTAQQVFNTTDVMGEIDALTIRQNAVRAAWGYRTQATDAENRALFARSTAAGISPGMAGFTSLLGSATSIAGSYYQMQKTGMFDKKPAAKGSFNYAGSAG